MKQISAIALTWLSIALLTTSADAVETKVDTKQQVEAKIETALQDEKEVQKPIIGRAEKVRVIPGDFIFEARIDTGATTCSIGVDEFEIVNEDGKDWVIVTLEGKKSRHKLVKYIFIKQHGNVARKRPVVKMRLILGNVSESVNVTLSDRDKFEYQLLIGRNFLFDHFIVDVSQKYTSTPMPYEEQ